MSVTIWLKHKFFDKKLNFSFALHTLVQLFSYFLRTEDLTEKYDGWGEKFVSQFINFRHSD